MKLRNMKIENFRGYHKETSISFDENITGIIGKNDAGKSTILEALALFFDTDGIKPDANDINCFGNQNGNESFKISCEFDDFPKEVVIDSKAKTSFKAEYLLNKDGFLEIAKVFGKSGKSKGCYIKCVHPKDENLKDLLRLKIRDLEKRAKSLGVDENAITDKRVSSNWRSAIRQKVASISLEETCLDISKDIDSKDVSSCIINSLPKFALFKSDRESSDGDAEAKNPLQQAVKEAKDELEKDISRIEEEIEKRTLDVANRTLEKLKEMDPKLAKELVPKFRERPKWTFNFTLEGENGIPINKRGSGVRRLILLNFFRAEAERLDSAISSNVIYAIEEPETSQHPNYQKMLMKSLLELSEHKNRQILITTHVPALAEMLPVDSIRYVTRDENGSPLIKEKDCCVIEEVADSLGILADVELSRAKGIILVEGKSDICFLKHASKQLFENDRTSYDFENEKFIPIPVGGSGSIKYWVTYRLSEKLGIPWCVLLDSDIGGDERQVRAIKKRKLEVEESGAECFITRKREVENYLCPLVIKNSFGVDVEITDSCDAKKLIADKIKIKKDDVFSNIWPLMMCDDMIRSSMYEDNGENKVEIIELVDNIGASLKK